MENLEKALGDRIKTLRKLRGWTQENLAELSGPEVCDPHEQPGRRYLTLPGMVQGGAN